MMAGKSKWTIFVTIGVVMALVVFLIRAHQSIHFLEQRPSYSVMDQNIVASAFQRFAQEERVSIEHARSRLYAVVVHLRDRRCVQIMPVAGGVGGHAIYCFSPHDETVLENYRMGE